MRRRDIGVIRDAIVVARAPHRVEVYDDRRSRLSRRRWLLWVRAHNRITMRHVSRPR